VGFPRPAVWALMADVERMAACMPGARLDGPPVGDLISGTISVKLGPIAASFAGVGRVARSDEGWRGAIEGEGRDQRSASRARGRIEYRLVEDGSEATKVDVAIAYQLSGPLAQFGRSALVRDFVGRLAEAFAKNVEARLADPGGAKAAIPERLEAGPMLRSLLLARLKAFFARLFRRD
jgi:carbon-monoxide dehydrogenase small subunit